MEVEEKSNTHTQRDTYTRERTHNTICFESRSTRQKFDEIESLLGALSRVETIEVNRDKRISGIQKPINFREMRKLSGAGEITSTIKRTREEYWIEVPSDMTYFRDHSLVASSTVTGAAGLSLLDTRYSRFSVVPCLVPHLKTSSIKLNILLQYTYGFLQMICDDF